MPRVQIVTTILCRGLATPALLLLLASGACTDESATLGPRSDPAFARQVTGGVSIAQLPTLGGHAQVYSINDANIAVGYSTLASGPGYTYAARWAQTNGVWTVAQVGGLGTTASAINEAGTIVGDSGLVTVVWRDGGSVVLGRGHANGINEANTVVGIRYEPGLQAPAAWRQGSGGWTVTSLDRVPGTTGNIYCIGEATAISGSGIVVGFLFDSGCVQQYAVKWMPKPDPADGWEAAEPLENAAGMAKSIPYAIVGNTIVGVAWPCAVLDGCPRRAYRWSLLPGSSDTGPLGSLDARANGLNALGESVGSYLSPKRMRAVSWSSAGAPTTLPEVSTFNTHWVWDINNPAAGRTARLAVGGATSDRGGISPPLVWTIP
jgi:hypothetical protein